VQASMGAVSEPVRYKLQYMMAGCSFHVEMTPPTPAQPPHTHPSAGCMYD
jgi:hypothetical protein